LNSADTLELLHRGELELEGRLIDASNATLLAFVTFNAVTVRCVYKPVRGERPLWDFPDGTLADREVAAYLISEATGWGCVPPTVLRDGPYGAGSCQLWIEGTEPPLVDFAHELPAGWYTIAAGQGGLLGHADEPGLARIALYDSVVNNADRKGSHLLRAADRRIYGIDHGVCFHVKDKLRTVLWGWAGAPLSDEDKDVLLRLRRALGRELNPTLATHLTRVEIVAMADRIDRLVTTGKYPEPSDRWPSLPWPAL
jgi:uncharacterized repeat protein (TIGR03843 family)